MKYTYLLVTSICFTACLLNACQFQEVHPRHYLVNQEEKELQAQIEAKAIEALETPYLHLYDMRKKPRGLRKNEYVRAQQKLLRQSAYRKAKARIEEEYISSDSELMLRVVKKCTIGITYSLNNSGAKRTWEKGDVK